MKKLTKKKIAYLKQQLEDAQNVPLRTLTLSEFQQLLIKISLALFIIIEQSLSINHKIMNFQKFEKDKIDEITFADFKSYIMALFGINLSTLSANDIDSILRKVHKELVIHVGKEVAKS